MQNIDRIKEPEPLHDVRKKNCIILFKLILYALPTFL